MRVLILGSYDDAKIETLRKLKTELISLGFDDCKLVEDFGDDAGLGTYEKSVRWIGEADICVVILMGRGHDDGVYQELLYIATGKLWKKCLLAYQKNLASQGKVSSLFPGSMYFLSGYAIRIDYTDFVNLVDRVSGRLFTEVQSRRIELRQRKDGAWELNQC